MRIQEIWRYPVKSAQGESVERSVVTNLGLEWDRQIAVVDVATGRPLTGRREPKLLLLSATVVGGRVCLSADGRPVDSDADLSGWLGRAVVLARPPIEREPEYEFPVDPEDEAGSWGTWKGPSDVWHDVTSTKVSMLSSDSLGPWPVRRFRPNLLVDSGGEVDLVGRRIAVGSVVMDVMSRIVRCVMLTRAQPGGIERDLDVLRSVQRDFEGCLGVGALVVEPGELRVGDEVRVLAV